MFKAGNHYSSLCSLILLTLLFFILSTDVQSQEVCTEDITGCCDGYFWSYKNNGCESCGPGYSGQNCTTSCPYPTYGHRCQDFCDCDEDKCNVSTGCEPNTTACGPGYIGQHCTTSCPYPTYGHRCQDFCDCDEDKCNVSTGCEPLTTEKTGETTIIENTTYHITETFTFGQPLSKSSLETSQILLLLIELVGCIDIVLLSAYVVICIHDRKQRATDTKFSSPGQQSSGRTTAYENIEVVSFLSSR